MASDAADGLIGILGMLIFGMLLLTLAFIVVVVIITGFAYSAPFWGTGILSAFIPFVIWKRTVVDSACSLPQVTNFVRIDLSDATAKSVLDTKAIEAYSQKRNPTIILIIVSVLVTLLLLLLQYKTSPMSIPFPPIGETKKPLSIGLSTLALVVGCGMGIAFFYLLVHPQDLINSAINKRLSKNLYHIEYAISSHKALQQKIEEVQGWYKKFSVPFINDYIQQLNQFISSHKIEILSDTSLLDSHIISGIKRVEGDILSLEKSYNFYFDTLSLYEETFIAVNQSQRASLLDSLDKIVVKLKKDLPQLITHKQFSEFDIYIKQAYSFLETIKYNAEHGNGYSHNSSGSQTSSHTNLNDPYELLGVTPEMSLSLIKKVYHQLSKIYHADLHSGISDSVKKNMEERMKQINTAFEQIEKEKTKVA